MTSQTSDTIFVTGGAGFIGSHVVRRLAHMGKRVSVLVKHDTGLDNIRDVLSGVSLVYGDLLDPVEVAQHIRDTRPSGVFHFAASNIKSGIAAADDEVVRTNFLGTVNLIKAMDDIPYRFFVNSGSFLEYGMKRDPVKETDRCDPQEVYSISKLSATLYGSAMGMSKKKPIITFRTFTPYGPCLQKGRLVYEAVARALRNEPIQLTSPEITRDFIFVEDLADLFLEGMEKAGRYPGAIFNAGTGRATTLKELTDAVLNITGSRSTIEWGAFHSVSYDSDRWQANMEKTYASFDWRPAHTVEAGLTKTVQWFRDHLFSL
jgi:nucleoside-diphosphate-sugar epimerase